MTLTELEGERSTLGRLLLSRTDLSSDWVPSFAAVPRAPFLPDVMWPYDMDTGTTVTVDRREDPDTWHRYANSNVPVVTQWDDGASEGQGTVSTSSASMPSVVFSMLRDLDVQAGYRVLEIGTGTGWNAALLAHRLGRSRVVTIEVDPQVADQARASLEAFGLPVTVVTGDGALGHAGGAPYDRIISTAGLRQVPAAWLEQTRPGGLIVAPWGTHFSHQDAVARLVVSEDGASASGHFTGPVQFMKLRAQRTAFDGHDAYVPERLAGAERYSTHVREDELLGGGRFSAALFAVGLRVRDCWHQAAPKRDGARPVWFYSLSDRSWACVMFRDGAAKADVWQAGPRWLWGDVLEALTWWKDEEEPGYERLGLTVTAESQHAWLDRPENSWPV